MVARGDLGDRSFRPCARFVQPRQVKRDDAVGDALELQIRALGGPVVEHWHRAFAADEACLRARICRRQRSEFCASRRSSESESNTIRSGRIRSMASSTWRVVLVSSTSPGWYQAHEPGRRPSSRDLGLIRQGLRAALTSPLAMPRAVVYLDSEAAAFAMNAATAWGCET